MTEDFMALACMVLVIVIASIAGFVAIHFERRKAREAAKKETVLRT